MGTKETDLLEQIGKAEESFTVRRVFGEPFEKDGVTVIPAARVQGAVGGGGGQAPGGEGGTGTGFAMNTKPFGVFVMKDGEVGWRPAVDVNRMIARLPGGRDRGAVDHPFDRQGAAEGGDEGIDRRGIWRQSFGRRPDDRAHLSAISVRRGTRARPWRAYPTGGSPHREWHRVRGI